MDWEVTVAALPVEVATAAEYLVGDQGAMVEEEPEED